MASNLFLLKGWTITLIAALFALASKDSNEVYLLIAFLPALMFWALDGYFLSQERRFRALYDHVRNLAEDKVDFSMDTQPFKGKDGCSWAESVFSRTILLYYGALIVAMIVVMVLLERRMR